MQFEANLNIEVKATMEVSSLSQCDLVQDVEGDDVIGMDLSNVEVTSIDKQNLEVGLSQRLFEILFQLDVTPSNMNYYFLIHLLFSFYFTPRYLCLCTTYSPT